MNVSQFKDLIITPTLEAIGMHSPEAVELLLGTAIQESRLEYIKQLPDGPALGVYQMEPATHQDIWENYLEFRPEMADKIKVFSLANGQSSNEMVGNLFYATAMARVHYRRVPKPLPAVGDLEGQADYWKEFYNTFEGAGTVEEYIEHYSEATFGL